MRGAWRLALGLTAILVAFVLFSPRGYAHKPITSPYTFNEHVFPILEQRCLRCHMSGGAAPMSLATHAEAVPWGESIRMELIAGHMPPWPVATAPARFRNAGALTGRELNVLLTWASGGTPVGEVTRAPLFEPARGWPMGPPDLALQMPSAFTLAADQQEAVAEFTLATGITEARWVRAVDLLPGTPAIVRSATVSIAGQSRGNAGSEQLLALWLPGDPALALDPGVGFRLPAGAQLVVRLRYKKTWEYERMEMTDRSTVGLYFADGAATDVRTLALTPLGATVDQDFRALAIYPDAALADVDVTATAVRPDGSRVELIAFRPQAGWARRYWFAQPIPLPRGTTISVTARLSDGALLPPGALPRAAPPDLSTVRLILNVISPS